MRLCNCNSFLLIYRRTIVFARSRKKRLQPAKFKGLRGSLAEFRRSNSVSTKIVRSDGVRAHAHARSPRHKTGGKREKNATKRSARTARNIIIISRSHADPAVATASRRERATWTSTMAPPLPLSSPLLACIYSARCRRSRCLRFPLLGKKILKA